MTSYYQNTNCVNTLCFSNKTPIWTSESLPGFAVLSSVRTLTTGGPVEANDSVQCTREVIPTGAVSAENDDVIPREKLTLEFAVTVCEAMRGRTNDPVGVWVSEIKF